MLIPTLSITPTETPIPPAEVVEQATKVIDAFNSLGFGLAALFVISIALALIGLVIWSGRNSNSTALSVLISSNAQKDKDLVDLKAQRDQENKQHLERMDALNLQLQRTNDLNAQSNDILIAVNTRGLERDVIQKQLSEDIHAIVTTGSLPVQEILSRVRDMADMLTRVDTRTADWNAIALTITPLMIELGTLKAEAKKHSTQPIPAIEVPPATETPQ